VVNHSRNGWLNICGSPACGRDQSCVVSTIGPTIRSSRGGQRRGADNQVVRVAAPLGGELGAEVPTDGGCICNDL
jgi:hypothetical protein